MKNRKINWIIAFGILMISACHTNEEEVTFVENNDPPKVTVSTVQTARIINENGTSLTNYDATYNAQQQNDLSQAFLIFDGKRVKKYGEKMTITTSKGKVSDFVVSGLENDINYTVLTVFEQRNQEAFDHLEKKVFPISKNINLQTQTTTYTLNGNSYAGKVNLTYFSPDVGNTFHLTAIPTNRVGKELNGERNYLDIYEAFYLDLIADNGQNLEAELNITNHWLNEKDNKLWFFDVENAVWKIIETTNRNQIHSFTHKKKGFYCIARSIPGLYVSGYLDLSSKPVSNLRINLKFGNSSQSVFTSALGKWTAFLPSESDINAEIVAECGTLTSFNIKTKNTPIANLKTSLESSRRLFANIVGQVKDCNGELNTDYILKNHTNNTTYYFTKGSTTDILIPVCGLTEVALSTSSINGREEGNIVLWPVNDIIETGTWFACDMAKKPYFNLIIDGVNKMYWQSKTQKNIDGRWVIALTNGQLESVLTITVPDDGVGNKSDNRLNILLREKSFEGNSYEIYCPTSTQGCGFDHFEITHFDYKDDKWIRGYFKGRFWVKTLTSLTAGYKNVEGEFQVKKEF